jgi:hypothetical protein
MAIKTRKPTGAVPWPLILIEGSEKSGKTWACATFSGSKRLGQMYWIDLGEGSADEYGAIPGADYLIVEHDGSFAQILAAVRELHGMAAKELAAGRPPLALTIDSMTAEWELLKDWATNRAMGSRTNKAKLARDPNAEIKVSTNYWNDANGRHRELMRLLMTFPGPVLMTARGKQVAVIGDNGQPVEGKKDYRVEAHKTLGFDASCWVRLSRDHEPLVVGARSVHSGIRPGIDDPKTLPEDWTLEQLIFDLLRCDPTKARVRDLVEGKPERTPEQIAEEAIKPGTSFDRLAQIHQEAKALGYESVVLPNESGQDELLLDLIARFGKARRPASDEQRSGLERAWEAAGDFADVESRLRYASEIVGRQVLDLGSLTGQEVHWVLNRLDAYIKQNTPPADGAPQAGEAA